MGFQDLPKASPSSLFILCGCISSSMASLMSRFMYSFWGGKFFVSFSSINQDHIIRLYVLSHIINHEHVSIAFAIIIRVALQEPN